MDRGDDVFGGGGGTPAFLTTFTAEEQEAFKHLTAAMQQKSDILLEHGKFKQSYKAAAKELMKAPDFEATDVDPKLVAKIQKDLHETAKEKTLPPSVAPHLPGVIETCSKYLGQLAEYNKEKGAAFYHLVNSMKSRGDEVLYDTGKRKSTFAKAAVKLEEAKGLETKAEDKNLVKDIHTKLDDLVKGTEPKGEAKEDMADALDKVANYLAHTATSNVDRGPVFDVLVKALEDKSAEKFTPEYPHLDIKGKAARVLRVASDLRVATPDPRAAKLFSNKLHESVDKVTPKDMKDKMKGTIDECSNFLSSVIHDEQKLKRMLSDMDGHGAHGTLGMEGFPDRGPAFGHLIKTLEENPNEKFAPEISPFLDTKENAAYILKTAPVPLKVSNPDLKTAGEVSKKLQESVSPSTPAHLKDKMKDVIEDSGGYLSVAIKDEAKLKKLFEDREKSGRRGSGGATGSGSKNKGAHGTLGMEGFPDRGSAFANLIKTLEEKPNEKFAPEISPFLDTKENAAYILKTAPVPLKVPNPDPKTAGDVSKKLQEIVTPSTPAHLKDEMKDVIEDSSGYLSVAIKDEAKLKKLLDDRDKLGRTGPGGATASGSKDKGAHGTLGMEGFPDRGSAFAHLIKTLEEKPNEKFAPEISPFLDTNENAAYILKTAPVPLKVPNPDTKTAGAVSKKLHETVTPSAPTHLKDEMKDVIEDSGGYLSVAIKDEAKLKNLLENRDKLGRTGSGGATASGSKDKGAHGTLGMEGFPDRGPAFAHLIKTLEEKPNEKFAPEISPFLDTKENAAYVMKTAPLPSKVSNPDLKTAAVVSNKLQEVVAASTPEQLKNEMKGVIEDTSGYLSVAIKDEEKLKKLFEDREKLGKTGSGVTAQSAGSKDKGAHSTLGMEGFPDRGQAFAHLIKTLEEKPKDKFTPEVSPFLDTRENGAYILKTAPVPLKVSNPDPKTASVVSNKLQEIVMPSTPTHLKDEMKGIIEDSSGYISVAVKDEAKLKKLLEDREKLSKAGGKDGMAGGKEGMAGGKEGMAGGKEGVAGGKDGVAGSKGAQGSLGMHGFANRGPAFAHLINTLEEKPKDKFTPNVSPFLNTRENAAYVLKTAPTPLKVSNPDPKVAAEVSNKLHEIVDPTTPAHLKEEMKGIIEDSSGYLSVAIKDEEKLKKLLQDREKIATAAGKAGSQQGALGDIDAHKKGSLENAAYTRKGKDADAIEQERQEALSIVKTKLASRGGEILHNQEPTSITYGDASKLVGQGEIQAVRGIAETKRVAVKVERKLSDLVKKDTPEPLREAMQDAVIESSRRISEFVIAKNFRILAREVLIAELQKGGDQLLVEQNGVEETAFFAAQRLKRANALAVTNPDEEKSNCISRRIEYLIRCQPIPRKLLGIMKEHIHAASDYLSKCVGLPDPYIESYITLLRALDSAGDKILVSGTITKTCKQSAEYLKQLISFNDEIKKPNSSIQSRIESEMSNLVKKLPDDSYDKNIMPGVIKDCAALLASYISLQELKTNALRALVELLKKQDSSKTLLRHGNAVKTYIDAATVLQGRTIADISATGGDAVAMRKIELRLETLLAENPKIPYMDVILDEVTTYLAVRLLQPFTRHICKCRRDILVQCELWCDEVLRKVSAPCSCCTKDDSKEQPTRLCASRIRPDLDAHITTCPTLENKLCPARQSKCISNVLYVSDAPNKPKYSSKFRVVSSIESCAQTQQNQLSSSTDLSDYVYDQSNISKSDNKTRPHTCYDNIFNTNAVSKLNTENIYKNHRPKALVRKLSPKKTGFDRGRRSPIKHLIKVFNKTDVECATDNNDKSNINRFKCLKLTKASDASFPSSKLSRSRSEYSSYTTASDEFHLSKLRRSRSSHSSISKSTFKDSVTGDYTKTCLFNSRGNPMTNKKYDESIFTECKFCSNVSKISMTTDTTNTTESNRPIESIRRKSPKERKHFATERKVYFKESKMTMTMDIAETRKKSPKERTYTTSVADVQSKIAKPRKNLSKPQTAPIARSSIDSTEEMSDWHAVLISVIWNIHAWRFWIQDSVNDIFTFKTSCKWSVFKRRMIAETEKWSQYNRFSKRLIQVLSERYKSAIPQKKLIKSGEFQECQSDIEEILNMSQRLIQWLNIIINDSSTTESGKKTKITDDVKWRQFNKKVKEFLNVWYKYDVRVKLYLKKKYGSIISGYLSQWDEPGPVWVMSACGAVPSGAVVAGYMKGEIIWLARTTHKCSLLPAALIPSQHNCIIYSNSKMLCYTKYEVLCNAEVIWEAWRAGTIHPRAVAVTSEVYIGRIQFHGSHIIGGVHGPKYRCHVALYNKPFTFNSYELLVNSR